MDLNLRPLSLKFDENRRRCPRLEIFDICLNPHLVEVAIFGKTQVNLFLLQFVS